MKCVSVQITCGAGNSIYKNITDKTGLAQPNLFQFHWCFFFERRIIFHIDLSGGFFFFFYITLSSPPFFSYFFFFLA